MRYSKFYIKNFKGIKELTFSFGNDPNIKVYTLVGLNESGKTTILEAINSFQKSIDKDARYKLIPKNERLNFNDSIIIRSDIVLSDFDNKSINNFAKSLGYVSIERIDNIAIEKKYDFDKSNAKSFNSLWGIKLKGKKPGARNYKTISVKKEVDSDWQKIVSYIRTYLLPTILYYPNFLFDFPERIYLNDLDDLLGEISYTDVIQDILYSIDQNLTIKDHIIDRLEDPTPANLEFLDSVLSKMSSKVSTVVFQAWSKLFGIVGKEIVIKAGSVNDSNIIKHYFEFKLKDGSTNYYISERSLGFKWFFTFLLFTEFRKNRITETSEILFLLDEPASNLHSTAQKNLLQTFKDIINKSSLIYTTHSHHLINPEWLNGIYIVRNKNLNYSQDYNYDISDTDIEAVLYKQFVARHPDQKDYFQPILDTLDFQPGLLEKVPEIIITEGKSDYFILKYLVQVYFEDRFLKLRFYPGNGANTLNDIIRLYLAWGRKFLILLDSDTGGSKAKIIYQKLFGFEITDSLFTFLDVSKEFKNCAIEDLFNDEDRLSICKHYKRDIVVYDKGIFNISIQSLFAKKSKVNLSKETLGRFEKILSFLVDKLEYE